MKIVAACLAGVISAFSAFSAQMASQQWVRDYVRTNSSGGGVSAEWVKTYHADHSVKGAATEEWVKRYVAGEIGGNIPRSQTTLSFTDDEGATATVTFNWTVATNKAMVVDGSNVPGMTNGTKFAFTSGYNYRNTGNHSCEDVTGVYENYGYRMTDGYWQYVTNGVEVTTNAVYATTNDYWTVRYHAIVGGVEYISYPVTPGYHVCAVLTTNDVNLSTNVFYLRECVISDAEKKRLLAVQEVRSRWSFIDFLIPSAYAITFNEDGNWLPGKANNPSLIWQHFDGDPGYTEYYYYGHWYTDSSDCTTIGLATFSWTTSTGQSSSYDVNYDYMTISSGEDLCDHSANYKALQSNYSSVEAEVVAEAKAEIENAIAAVEGAAKAKNRMTQLNRQPGFEQALKAMVEEYYYWLGLRLNGRKCPEEKTETVDDPKDDEPDPDPPTPPDPPPRPYSCSHGNLKGNCEKWVCGFCKQTVTAAVAEKFNMNTSHHWVWTQNGRWCKRCDNHNPRPNGVLCNVSYAGPGMDQYHTGWHNQNITLNDSSAEYPGWLPTYRYLTKNGTPKGCYERCAGGACLRNHNIKKMNKWVPIVDKQGNSDELQDARVCRCENKKYADSSDDICGFGEDGETDVMLEAGVWSRAQHVFVPSYRIKGHESEKWQASTNDPDNVCTIQRYCQHETDSNGFNCGCGLAENGRHNGEHQWYTTKSLGFGEQWVCGSGGDNGDTNKHYEVMKCAHDRYFKDGKYQHHGCGMTRRPGSANYPGSSHIKEYPERADYVDDSKHRFTAWCEKRELGCNWKKNIVAKHNYEFFDCMYAGNEEHIERKICSPRGTDPGCKDIKYGEYEDHRGDTIEITEGDNYEHIVSKYCNSCTNFFFVLEEHDGLGKPKWDFYKYAGPIKDPEGIYNIDATHYASNYCQKCSAWYGGGQYCNYSKTRDWQMNDEEEYDTATCEDCGESTSFPHVFVSIGGAGHECRHFCVGGVSPSHLFGSHDTDGEWGSCSVCGYSPEPPEERCSGCSCCFVRNGSATCMMGWDYDNKKCGCAVCQGESSGSCVCEGYVKIIDKLTNPSIIGTSYIGRKAHDSTLGIVNGDDPVYYIGNGALSGAYVDCVNLESIRFNMVTNIGDGGCSGMASDCPSLRIVGFRNLAVVEQDAFSDAFQRCPNLRYVDFNSLKFIGLGAFYKAFNYCDNLMEIEFPHAEHICNDAFGGAFGPNAFVTFSGVKTIEGSAFSGILGYEVTVNLEENTSAAGAFYSAECERVVINIKEAKGNNMFEEAFIESDIEYIEFKGLGSVGGRAFYRAFVD